MAWLICLISLRGVFLKLSILYILGKGFLDFIPSNRNMYLYKLSVFAFVFSKKILWSHIGVHINPLGRKENIRNNLNKNQKLICYTESSEDFLEFLNFFFVFGQKSVWYVYVCVLFSPTVVRGGKQNSGKSKTEWKKTNKLWHNQNFCSLFIRFLSGTIRI